MADEKMNETDQEQVKALEFVLPKSGSEPENTMVSPSIESDLTKKKITGLSIQEASVYESGGYLIDVSGCEDGVSQESSEALKLLMSEQGTVPIYVSNGTMVFMVGRMEQYKVYQLLNRLLVPLFGSGVKLFMCIDGKFKRIKSVKLGEARLNL